MPVEKKSRRMSIQPEEPPKMIEQTYHANACSGQHLELAVPLKKSTKYSASRSPRKQPKRTEARRTFVSIQQKLGRLRLVSQERELLAFECRLTGDSKQFNKAF